MNGLESARTEALARIAAKAAESKAAAKGAPKGAAKGAPKGTKGPTDMPISEGPTAAVEQREQKAVEARTRAKKLFESQVKSWSRSILRDATIVIPVIEEGDDADVILSKGESLGQLVADAEVCQPSLCTHPPVSVAPSPHNTRPGRRRKTWPSRRLRRIARGPRRWR